MLREVFVIMHSVVGGWIVNGEGRVRVLTMEAFLVAIDPEVLSVFNTIHSSMNHHTLSSN